MLSILKRLIIPILNPKGLAHIGAHSQLSWPRRLGGQKHIHIGAKTLISAHSWLEAIDKYAGTSFSPKIVIGNNVQIGRYATITSIEEVRIGNGCLLSEHVYISDHAHDVFAIEQTPLAQRPLIKKGRVEIGNLCFIGFRSVIMPGVKLGDHCVVGAGSIVTKSFESGSVIAGVPAKLVRKLNDQ